MVLLVVRHHDLHQAHVERFQLFLPAGFWDERWETLVSSWRSRGAVVRRARHVRYISPARFLFGQHHSLVQQGQLDVGWVQLARLAVHLHRYCLGRDDPGGAALGNAGTVAAGLQQRQLVGGEANHLDHAIVGGRLKLATGFVPRMRTTTVADERERMKESVFRNLPQRTPFPTPLPWNVEEYYRVHLVLLELRCQILAVALERHELGQTLPLALQQILAAGLAIEHFISQPRVELFRMRLCREGKQIWNAAC